MNWNFYLFLQWQAINLCLLSAASVSAEIVCTGCNWWLFNKSSQGVVLLSKIWLIPLFRLHQIIYLCTTVGNEAIQQFLNEMMNTLCISIYIHSNKTSCRNCWVFSLIKIVCIFIKIVWFNCFKLFYHFADCNLFPFFYKNNNFRLYLLQKKVINVVLHNLTNHNYAL